VVLDASAVLASFLGESGGALVLDALPNALLSAVNYTEALTRLLDRGVPESELTAAAADIVEIVEPFDEEQARLAAGLRPATRDRGLSLGDRACLALALSRGLPTLTADRRWSGLAVGVEIRLLR
jgi:ribonuclease VapC